MMFCPLLTFRTRSARQAGGVEPHGGESGFFPAYVSELTQHGQLEEGGRAVGACWPGAQHGHFHAQSAMSSSPCPRALVMWSHPATTLPFRPHLGSLR